MSPRPSNPLPKRPRGRPKGTAPFAQQDRRVLAAFADGAIGMPHAELTPFLRQRGYEDKDVRRALKRWREEGPDLLREAQLRADAAPPESIFDLIVDLVQSMSFIRDAARPAFDALSRSLARARRRAEARKAFGLDPGLPFDQTDPAKVEEAIRRFEQTVGAGYMPPGLEGRTIDALPLSLKLYSAAVMLHVTSLQVAGQEIREATASGGEAAQSREPER